MHVLNASFMLIKQNGKVSLIKIITIFRCKVNIVTGAPWCDFVVYTVKDMLVERILQDIPVMICMLLKLSLFNKYYAVSYMQKK